MGKKEVRSKRRAGTTYTRFEARGFCVETVQILQWHSTVRNPRIYYTVVRLLAADRRHVGMWQIYFEG